MSEIGPEEPKLTPQRIIEKIEKNFQVWKSGSGQEAGEATDNLSFFVKVARLNNLGLRFRFESNQTLPDHPLIERKDGKNIEIEVSPNTAKRNQDLVIDFFYYRGSEPGRKESTLGIRLDKKSALLFFKK